MSSVVLKNVLIGLSLIGLLVSAGYWAITKIHLKPVVIKSLSAPITHVRIGTVGAFQYLLEEDVKAALLPHVLTSFFDADMQAIHLAVAALPWVDTVAVKRTWPDIIDIKIRERKPYARWGKDSLITGQGDIFTPNNVSQFQHLTLVIGPLQQQVKVLEIMKGVKTALADQSMGLAEFSVNERGAWKIKLTTGLDILLGRNEQLNKLQRFLKTLNVLRPEQFEQMALVDLRYPNGYAVSWKPGSIEIDWAAIADPETTTQAKDKAKQSR